MEVNRISTPHLGPLPALQRHTSSGFAIFSPSDAEKGIEAERIKPSRLGVFAVN
jgi:hypothetical protein